MTEPEGWQAERARLLERLDTVKVALDRKMDLAVEAELEIRRATVAEWKRKFLERQPRWQSIETAPKNTYIFMRIVPKLPEESYQDTSGNPIVANFEPYVMRGQLGWWGGLSKATHWYPDLKLPNING